MYPSISQSLKEVLSTPLLKDFGNKRCRPFLVRVAQKEEAR